MVTRLPPNTAGIRVGRVKLLAYTISGLGAGIASVLSLGYYGAGSSGDGQGYELNVIAATIVGGASFAGGKGTALGALLGAIILQMISNGLVILNIPQNYGQIVIGLVVIAAVVLDQFNTWATKRRTLARTSSIKKEVVQGERHPCLFEAENHINRMAFLTVEHISKTFPGVRALDDVSVEFEKGSIHALMGENGAGKSTLGKIIAGVYSPDKGVIKIEGQEVKPTDPRIAQELGIALVHQELAFCPNMTVGRESSTWRISDKCRIHELD